MGGASGLPFAETWNTLGSWLRGSSEGIDPIARAIVLDVRAPRIVLLILAGASLAAAGASLQACLQNPLADPGLLGLSGGASLGAVAAYSLDAHLIWPFAVPALAFVGAFVAIGLVYVIAHAGGRPTTGSLLLTGVAVASFTSAIVSVLLMSTGDHRVHEIVAWLLGSAEGRSWEHVRLAFAPVSLGLLGLLATQRIVDALALGEEHALAVGLDLTKGRLVVLALVALTAGGAVSVLGPIGFIGLIVPHMLRSVGAGVARWLIPLSALGGACLLVGSDLVSRQLSARVDVPVGVVTAMLGVPFFLALLHTSRPR